VKRVYLSFKHPMNILKLLFYFDIPRIDWWDTKSE